MSAPGAGDIPAAPDLATAITFHARRDPGGAALADDRSILTWAALEVAVDSAAAALAASGAGPDRRLALVVRPSAEAVVAIHAAIRLGTTVAMLDPRHAPPEIAARLEAVHPTVVVADDAVALADGAWRTIALTALRTGQAARAESVPVDALPAGPTPVDAPPQAVFLVPTSGTTGRPRIARLPVAALEASARAWSAVLPPSTGWLLTLGLAHVAGLGIVVRAALDGVPVLVPAALDTGSILAALDMPATDDRGTGVVASHLSLVPTQLTRLLDADPGHCPETVRAILLGGGPVPPALVTRALGAGWPVVPTYGMTETASGVTALPTAEAALAPETAGRPLPGVEVRIAGAVAVEGGDTSGALGGAPSGPVGRIEVRGPTVFAGYEGDDEASGAATADAITPDGWLRTRDVGRFDDEGRLVVVDRLDDLVISGGENIAPAEVEAVLLRHAAVADAGVVGLPDDEWGAVLVAAIVPRAGKVADAAEIRAFVGAQLAGPRVPARIAFLGVLPRTESGKLLRRELRPRLDQPPLVVDEYPGPTVDGSEGPGRHADARPTVLLLHATLSSALQLRPLARRLEPLARVLVPDRRGSGRSTMAVAAPLPLAAHVADALEVLDRDGVERAVVVGHSFGGVVALELAARHPDRVAGLLAWEPPYLALAPGPVRAAMAELAARVSAAHATDGSAAAARLFLERVAGPGAWDALHPRQREVLGAAGDGVLADISMPDLAPEGLARISAPAILATGERSEPFYHPIAAAVADRIPGARLVRLPALRHPAPITDPDPIAELVRDLLAADPAAAAADAAGLEEPR